ncbi:4-alpha-glucanotransferase [Halobacteroides halobius DSM 5150]|uniref:4-alpha-glucanotransferase n=1 Tax=Halobacteroides halobius (strain ATCC 35273 / DSM 5150 / MD-1) TaxID=748449 RepID=L0K9W7_HALHC|nr:4-alpha-glucanotransferase [Halobacteroides halobius]AGB40898.1 4-alpha-glucanotransferase [Halobacteroides halobius DSM 5150]
MKFERKSGIFLHPTSLPGEYGIGSLGAEAYQFIDFLSLADQGLWQVCPLGPTGYGDSPYQPFSAFAGNPYLISLDKLVAEGLLAKSDLDNSIDFDQTRVEYGKVIDYKMPLLKKAFKVFKNSKIEEKAFNKFCRKNKKWLADYALFRALKDYFGGQAWVDWDYDIKFREEEAIVSYQKQLKDQIEFRYFLQFIFFKQWAALKKYANNKGIKIIGDIPAFIALDSADAWANSQFFCLDENRLPTKVAGTPPDYFSPKGQLWGNPLYDWKHLRRDNYQWWIDRFNLMLELTDIIRIDHFRAFISYWAVPYGKETAVNGNWELGPQEHFFKIVKKKLGKLPFIIEDLGLINERVKEVRNKFDFPGMKVLQFAFHEDLENKYLPHNYSKNSIVYTGTHDNNTTKGWYHNQAKSKEKNLLEEYTTKYLTESTYNKPSWNLLELAWSSKAVLAIAPLQDIISLGSQARLNNPGVASGNWQWKYQEKMLTLDLAEQLKDLTYQYNR